MAAETPTPVDIVKSIGIKIDSPIKEPTQESPALKQDFNLPNPSVVKTPFERAVPPVDRGREQGNGDLEDESQISRDRIISPNVPNLVAESRNPQTGENRSDIRFIAQSLKEQFAHLSGTRSLEINSERTKLIQEGVDEMTKGRNIHTKVIIMNKGEQAEAFVTPDGSIFISQSLINTLDTTDELMAVLAHEVGHLVFKTTYRSLDAAQENRFGVGWAHEAGCDAHARVLMEQGKFNTLAMSSAIEKIAGYERGTIHQGGLARSAQNILTHHFLDSSTSHLPQKTIPELLKGEVKKTNIEIIEEKLDAYSDDQFHDELSKLYPGDLKEVFDLLKGGKGTRKQLNIWESFASDKLIQEGYTKGESVLLLVSLGRQSGGLSVLEDIGDVEGMIASLEAFHSRSKRAEAYQKLFLSSPQGVFGSPVDPLMRIIRDNMYLYKGQKEIGFPVNDDIILKFFQVSQDLSDEGPYGKDDLLMQMHRGRLTEVLGDYLIKLMVEDKNTGLVQARSCLEKAKQLGLKIQPDYFKQTFYDTYQKKIKDPAYQAVIDSFYEVYGIEKEKDPDTEEIDRFFENLSTIKNSPVNEQSSKEEARLVSEFLTRLHKHYTDNGISDAERAQNVNYIAGKIDSFNFKSQTDLLNHLSGDPNEKQLSHDTNSKVDKLQDALIKFRLKTAVAFQLFSVDGPEFYQFLNEAMGKSGIDPEQLSQVQMLSLCQGLFPSPHGGFDSVPIFTNLKPEELQNGYSKITLRHLGEMAKLPFVESLLRRQDSLDQVTTIGQLNEHISNLFIHIPILRHQLFGGEYRPFDINLYGDNLYSLILSKDLIGKFESLVEQGVPESQFPDLQTFIRRFYPEGNNKTQIMRELNIRYLKSEGVSFGDKLKFTAENFDLVGPEGMVLLAEQIEDWDTYQRFRNRMGDRLFSYLDGSNTVSAMALGDFLSANITDKWELLLATTDNDPQTKVRSSTEFAYQWFNKVHQAQSAWPNPIEYRSEDNKFLVGGVVREGFQSIRDVFGSWKLLNPIQRMGLTFKALTEHNGAFSSEENRQKLATIFLDSLKIEDSFLKSSIDKAIQSGDASFIVGLAVQMIGPRLFSNLDTAAVDLDDLGNRDLTTAHGTSAWEYPNHAYSPEGVKEIVNSETRQIKLFAPEFQRDPTSLIAQVAQLSDSRYFTSTNRLKELLNISQISNENLETRESGIDPAIETLIRGVEASGPLGIRALQLAVQFYDFPPALHKRLSESFDANTGMNKLVFWENLHKLAVDELEGRNESGVSDPSVGEFLKKVKIGSKAGGGSEQTTYFAELHQEDGSVEPIVIKRSNPSIYSTVQATYSNSKRVLSEIAENGLTPEDREKAKTSLMLVDLANEWTIASINDKDFEKNDDLFRQTVDSYERAYGSDYLYVPERVFTHPKLKSEKRATGRTVNQALNDDSMSSEEKKDLVWSMTEFQLYQMRKNSFTDENGQKYYLVHSDPHVGNIMANVSGEDLKMGVIDRGMYLKLTESDVKVLDKLVKGGNITDFAYSFVDHVLDINNIRGMDKVKLTGNVFNDLMREYAQQVTHGGVDKFSLLQTMLTSLNKSEVHRVHVPLELRLMIRNIAASKQLTERFGVNIEEIDRSLDVAA